MRNKIIILLLVILDILALNIYIEQHTAAAPVALSARAPDFTWVAFDGSKHNFTELAGKAVVLHFWASWCAPCRTEFPGLLKAAAQAGNAVTFLTISSDDDLGKAKKFVRQAQKDSGVRIAGNVLYAFDPEKSITFDVFQTALYPETIIIDSAHRMRRKFPGPVDWSSRDTEIYLKQLQ